jgi:hypothetical protein
VALGWALCRTARTTSCRIKTPCDKRRIHPELTAETPTDHAEYPTTASGHRRRSRISTPTTSTSLNLDPDRQSGRSRFPGRSQLPNSGPRGRSHQSRVNRTEQPHIRLDRKLPNVAAQVEHRRQRRAGRRGWRRHRSPPWRRPYCGQRARWDPDPTTSINQPNHRIWVESKLPNRIRTGPTTRSTASSTPTRPRGQHGRQGCRLR